MVWISETFGSGKGHNSMQYVETVCLTFDIRLAIYAGGHIY